MRLGHLAKRFAGSLLPIGPRRTDDAWATEHLLPGEVKLWRRMSRVDRRHAAGVARRVDTALDGRSERPVIAAALLHDVGKVSAGLGTFGRVLATVAGGVYGHAAAYDWSDERGLRRKCGLYLRHPELGGDLLALAGSDQLTEAWAREHHDPEDRWTVPRDVGELLKAADDD